MIQYLPIPGLTAIQPRMSLALGTSGKVPFFVVLSADLSTWTRDADTDGLTPFMHLEYSWDFGDPGGTELIPDPATYGTVNAKTLNLNTCQTGAIATYCYRTPGTYTITMRARGWTGTEWIEATTTTVQVVPMWLLRPDISVAPTSGTFTLTVTVGEDSQTTDPLPYNTLLKPIGDAVAALSNVGVGNVEAVRPAYFINKGALGGQTYSPGLRFVGALAGTEVEVSATSSLNLGAGISPLRVQSVASSNTVTATANTATPIFVNTNAAPGGDGSSEASPLSTNAEFQALFTSVGDDKTNLWIKIARGSVLGRMSLTARNYSGLRIEAYGSGADPVIGDDNGIGLSIVFRYGITLDDVVISGVKFRGGTINASSYHVMHCYSTSLGGGTHRPAIKGFYLDRVSIESNHQDQDYENNGIAWEYADTIGWGVWRCSFVQPYWGQAMGLYNVFHSDNFCVGCLFSGGGPNNSSKHYMYFHHVYDNGYERALHSLNILLPSLYNSDRSRGRNFGWNMNIHQDMGGAENGPRRYTVMTRNLISGMTNGINFDSSWNSTTGPHFDQLIIEDNIIRDLGSLGVDSVAGVWSAGGANRLVVRRNDIRDFAWSKKAQTSPGGAAIGTGRRAVAQSWIYGNVIHSSGKIAVGISPEGGKGMIVGNRILLSGSGCYGVQLASTITGPWVIDHNEYNLGGSSSPTRRPFLATNGFGKTIAEWQAMGYDVNSTFRDTAKRVELSRILYEIVPPAE